MVSLIIVDYRTIPKTLSYIHNCYLAIMDSACLHTVIVDNGEDFSVGLRFVEAEGTTSLKKLSFSKDISGKKVEVYEGMFENRPLLYVCAKQNLGYAKGNNLGAEIVKEYYHDSYYLFSNNDLRFPKPFAIQQLIEPIQRSKTVAVVGPCITDINGEHQSPRKKSNAWRQLFLNYYDMLLPPMLKFTNQITDVIIGAKSGSCYWVTGSFLLVEADRFYEAGKFDENTFLYCEEVIFAERLQKYDYSMYYESGVSVIHEHGQTVKSTHSALQGIRISFESSLYYYKEYRGINKRTIALAKGNYILFAFLFSIKKKFIKIRARGVNH